jgi:hypothetical protein
MGERHQSPDPGQQIGDNEKAVDADDATPKASPCGSRLIRQENRFCVRSQVGPFIRKTFPSMSPQRKNRSMRAHRTPEG